jgi:hypothetical protein
VKLKTRYPANLTPVALAILQSVKKGKKDMI